MATKHIIADKYKIDVSNPDKANRDIDTMIREIEDKASEQTNVQQVKSSITKDNMSKMKENEIHISAKDKTMYFRIGNTLFRIKTDSLEEVK